MAEGCSVRSRGPRSSGDHLQDVHDPIAENRPYSPSAAEHVQHSTGAATGDQGIERRSEENNLRPGTLLSDRVIIVTLIVCTLALGVCYMYYSFEIKGKELQLKKELELAEKERQSKEKEQELQMKRDLELAKEAQELQMKRDVELAKIERQHKAEEKLRELQLQKDIAELNLQYQAKQQKELNQQKLEAEAKLEKARLDVQYQIEKEKTAQVFATEQRQLFEKLMTPVLSMEEIINDGWIARGSTKKVYTTLAEKYGMDAFQLQYHPDDNGGKGNQQHFDVGL